MTLDERIAKIFKNKGICYCGGRCECISYNDGVRDCATNLKQAFERGEICEVPSVEEIAMTAFYRSQVIDKNDVFKQRWNDLTEEWKKPWISIAKAIISLLTKGKDNEN